MDHKVRYVKRGQSVDRLKLAYYFFYDPTSLVSTRTTRFLNAVVEKIWKVPFLQETAVRYKFVTKIAIIDHATTATTAVSTKFENPNNLCYSDKMTTGWIGTNHTSVFWSTHSIAS